MNTTTPPTHLRKAKIKSLCICVHEHETCSYVYAHNGAEWPSWFPLSDYICEKAFPLQHQYLNGIKPHSPEFTQVCNHAESQNNWVLRDLWGLSGAAPVLRAVSAGADQHCVQSHFEHIWELWLHNFPESK